MSAEPAYLCIEALHKRFGATHVIEGLSLDIERREIFALLGSSGCGKSTLLRIIAGLETPDGGRIVLDGEDLGPVPAYCRATNMMFQSYALFPHMTVAANIAFGLRQLRPRPGRAQIDARVAEMLDLVQLQAYAARWPHELSGGQQQRVALARSLAREPKLLLLDEPLAALDKQIRQRTRLELVSLIRRVGVTCIFVTHDQEEAMSMATRIGIMNEGRLVQVGTPEEIYERPNCRFSAAFIGETNLLDLGAGLWLSLRPERVMLSRRPPTDAGATQQAEVTDIAYLGSHSLYHLRLGDGSMLIASVASSHWGDEPAPGRGEALWVAWRKADGVPLLQ